MRPTWQALFAELNLSQLAIPNIDEITPPANKLFRCFDFFDPSETRVVIVGQDPYPTPNVATGLAFEVNGRSIPPSLRNIVKEIKRCYPEATCNLENWARQGVLLLNRSLTTRTGESNSHLQFWKPITNAMIQRLSEYAEAQGNRLIFMLWGNNAQELERVVNGRFHLVLKHSHPSPLSRKRFIGNDHFRICNEELAAPIEW